MSPKQPVINAKQIIKVLEKKALSSQDKAAVMQSMSILMGYALLFRSMVKKTWAKVC